jgi:hypothetical protein
MGHRGPMLLKPRLILNVKQFMQQPKSVIARQFPPDNSLRPGANIVLELASKLTARISMLRLPQRGQRRLSWNISREAALYLRTVYPPWLKFIEN